MVPPPDNPSEFAPPNGWPGAPDEHRFARVVEASPTALVLTGPAGRIEMMNRQAERMFGYDREELANQPLEILMPARFRHGHVLLRHHYLGDMTSRQMGAGRDLYGQRKDGTEFPLEIGLNPIDLDGETMVLAGIIDITARRRIEYEKEQQRIELARSNADLEEFAYVASHDLKAPLRAISHLVEWISEDIEVTASTETIDNLKLLRGRVVRLQSLLDGLLAYARIGKARVSFEQVDIVQVVRDVVAVLSPSAGFTVVCEEPMPLLRTHRTPILVVLQNLISNGLKHHDRTEGRITVAMKLVDGVAEFRVSDDGPGIAPRFHERIFVIFQTLASRDDLESSGIGLAIVKKRVEAHGGRIWVESAPPVRGTTIVFTWKEPTA
jgi:PAS domain S-box-containing protein